MSAPAYKKMITIWSERNVSNVKNRKVTFFHVSSSQQSTRRWKRKKKLPKVWFGKEHVDSFRNVSNCFSCPYVELPAEIGASLSRFRLELMNASNRNQIGHLLGNFRVWWSWLLVYLRHPCQENYIFCSQKKYFRSYIALMSIRGSKKKQSVEEKMIRITRFIAYIWLYNSAVCTYICSRIRHISFPSIQTAVRNSCFRKHHFVLRWQ